MIAAIHQPNYIPWLGYFYKIYKSDVFVILDDVQYSKRSYTNRNKIKTPQGAIWLTVPINNKGSFELNINEIRTKDELQWKKNHIHSIKRNYTRSKYFKEFYEVLRNIILEEYNSISDLNTNLIRSICKILDINTKIILSSDLKVDGKSTDRLINICKNIGTDTYLSGSGGANYQDKELFKKHNIRLTYSDFKAEEYNQLWGDFVGNLSVIDYIFNCGYDIKSIFET